ncbi:MAG: hypothetical protein AAF927_12035 [Bacteroidota bacterium]
MKSYFPLIALLSLMACQTTERSALAEKQTQDLIPNVRWIEAVNNQQWENIYHKKAIKIEADGSLIKGREAIIEAQKQKKWQVEVIETIRIISTHRDSSYQYEIGQFLTSDRKTYYHLLIWNLEGEQPLRELEMIASGGTLDSGILAAIDQRRAEWIKLCNERDAANLVEQLYSENALYYNHKPMVEGRTAITQEYSYMNRPEYSLMLNPIIVQPVNDSLVFELGQCSGSYGGKYMLLWQKDATGKWYVSMDSNV